MGLSEDQEVGPNSGDAPSSRWRWSLGAGATISVLGLVLVVAPARDEAGFLRAAGVLLIVAAAVELVLAIANRRSKGKAAGLLAGSGFVAGGLLVFHSLGAIPPVHAAVTALGIRALGALTAAFVFRPPSHLWLLCRGGADLPAGLALLLIVPVTMAIALPLAVLSSLLEDGSAMPLASALLGGALAATLIWAGIFYLLIGLRPR